MSRLRRLVASRFLRDSTTLQIGAMLNAASGFVSALCLAWILGETLQGTYYVAIAVYSFLVIALVPGMQAATVSQVASNAAQGRTEKVADWLAFLLKINGIIGVLVLVLGWSLIELIVSHFYAGSDLGVDPRQLARWVAWLSIVPLVELPRVVAVASFQGTRRMLLLAQTENGTEIVRVFLVVVGALITRSPVGPVLGHISASAIGSVLALDLYVQARRDGGIALPTPWEILRRLRAVPLRAGVGLGVRLGLMRSMDAYVFQVLPPLVIQRFASSEWVAYMKIAQRIMTVPMMFMQGVSRTALPALSQLTGLQDRERFRHLYRRIMFGSGGLIWGGLAVALPLLPYVLDTFFPDSYVEPIHQLCLVLAIGFLGAAFSVSFDAFYLITNQLRLAIAVNTTWFLAAVAAMIGLPFWMPEFGVAWGITVAYLSGVFHTLYSLWFLDSRRWRGVEAVTA